MLDRSFLRSCESHEDAFLASVPVSSVSFFLSHSWSADGFWKQMALFICCSTSPACKVTLLTSLIAAYALHSPAGGITISDLIVLVIGFLSFLLALFIVPLFKHRNTMVFLDKCCIPQKDPIVKAYGISRLADNLHASDKLLILWSPDYLDRLWCVYELAVFLRTHDLDDVILVNMDHFKLCATLMILQFFSILALGLTEDYDPRSKLYVGYVLVIATSLLIGRGAFGCSQEWQKFCSRVKRFSVHKAKCSSSADYTNLKQLINDMYGSETKFETVVRGLWLGEGQKKHIPSWLFSGASLRVISATYVPLIVGNIVKFIVSAVRVDAIPAARVTPAGEALQPLPGKLHALLWNSRCAIIPVMMLCFRAPLMLLVGHALASCRISEKVGRWSRGVIFALRFCAYNCLTQMLCGLQIFYHPLRSPSISRRTHDALLWTAGVSVITVVSLILRRSSAFELLNDSF